MKSAYLIAGIRLSRYLKLVARNGVSLYPNYLVRFLFLLQNGMWASIFHRKENKLFKQKIHQQKLSDNPVIIIGHWRTGSTYLHQLLSLDSNFVTPNVFQASLPDSFLTSRKSYEPIMGRAVKGTRPMDQVKLGLDEPLEDEYALFRLSGYSPLEQIIFPKKGGYFLKNFPGFLPTNGKLTEWKEALVLFYKKLLLYDSKTILIKNPFHSLRLDVLNEIFPNARYIHIVRHPYIVVPSTQRMWDIVGSQNAMNTNWQKPEIDEVSEVLNDMLNAIDNNFKKIPDNRKFEIKFEDFEKNPKESIKKMYNQLNLVYTVDFDLKLNEFLLSIKDYQKNKYTLPEENKKIIASVLKPWMDRYNYNID
jgi:omega-hydroxy-beta-dihydromenaquinone-9 sulfotransferase